MARPKLPDNQLHQNALKIRLTDDEYKELEAIASRHGIPVAVLARAALKKGVELYQDAILNFGAAA